MFASEKPKCVNKSVFHRCTRVHSVIQSFPAIRISICRLSMSYTSKTWVQMVSTLISTTALSRYSRSACILLVWK